MLKSIIVSIAFLNLGCIPSHTNITGVVTTIEIHTATIFDICDYDHLTLVVDIVNPSDNTIRIPQGNRLDYCNPTRVLSNIKWVLPDTSFYLTDEERQFTDIILPPQEKSTIKFRAAFIAEGKYLNEIRKRYQQYIKDNFFFYLETKNHGILELNRSESLDIKFVLGDTYINKDDSVTLNFVDGPSASELNRLKKFEDMDKDSLYELPVEVYD